MLVCCFLLFFTINQGDIYEQFFNEANNAYYNGDFNKAIQQYEKLIQSGVEHPVIFYNLANAYYHLGKKGLAIANYERTLYLQPSFKLAMDNLTKVLNETKRNLALPAKPVWWRYLFFWHYGIHKIATWRISIILWLIFWTVLGIFKFVRKENRRMLLYVSVCVLIGSTLFLCSAVIKEFSHPLAVVITEKTEARVTPSDNSPTRFELYEGDRVLVEREEGEWTLIKVVNNERGWIKNSDIFIWTPPYRNAWQLMEES